MKNKDFSNLNDISNCFCSCHRLQFWQNRPEEQVVVTETPAPGKQNRYTCRSQPSRQTYRTAPAIKQWGCLIKLQMLPGQ